MIFGLICALLHVVLVFYVGEDVSTAILVRGASTTFVMGWILEFLFSYIANRHVRYFCYVIISAILALSHAHIIINGSYPVFSHIGLAKSHTFLLSILADFAIIGRLVIYISVVLALVYISERFQIKKLVSIKLQSAIVMILIIFNIVISFCPSCEVYKWQGNSLFDYYVLRGDSKAIHTDNVTYDGRQLIKNSVENGASIYQGTETNVILLFVEGLSQLHVDNNYSPELKKLSKQGLRVNYFVNHQRQTNRGLFSALCGAYPNLFTNEAKSDLMALGGLVQKCLPHLLKEHEYQSLFMQASPLGYMSKDLFAEQAGFDEAFGDNYVEKPTLRSSWGVDDHSFYKSVIKYLANRKSSQPYFLTLLTSGTHPPYNTPNSKDEYKGAFEFASRSVDSFYKDLLSKGLLKNTILIVTSDESSASLIPEVSDVDADNRGFLLALGENIKPTVNKSVFGLVDIPASILDHLKISKHGFGGRSFFREYKEKRTLYAGNTFRKLLYIYKDNDLFKCSHSLECSLYESYIGNKNKSGIQRLVIDSKNSADISSLIELISRNDLNADVLDNYLVQLPEKIYQGEASHQIIGRFISSVPVGEMVNVSINIDNNLIDSKPGNLFLDWVAFDCADKAPEVIRARWEIPAGMDNFNLNFNIEQAHEAQCHKVWVNTTDQTKSSPWLLKEFIIKKYPGYIPDKKISRPKQPGKVFRIAHAGGIYNDMDYTNSYEAIENSVASGFKYIELDFSWTIDNQMVCIHDWKNKFKKIFGFQLEKVPSLELFKEYNNNYRDLNVCTLNDLSEWLENHPEIKIITDIKNNNLKGLALMSEKFAGRRSQIIPQIYHPSEYEQVKKLGFEKIIWTLYRYGASNEAVLNIVERMGIYAVTMPESRAKSGLGRELHNRGIPSYVHTINDKKTAQNYFDTYGISEIYTDSLIPE